MGIPKKFVPTIGIFMDHHRKNMPLEIMQSNVHRLKIQGQASKLYLPKAGDLILTEELATAIQGSRVTTCPSLAAARSTCIRQAPCRDDEPAPVGSPDEEGCRRGERGEVMRCLWQLMDDVILISEFFFWST